MAESKVTSGKTRPPLPPKPRAVAPMEMAESEVASVKIRPAVPTKPKPIPKPRTAASKLAETKLQSEKVNPNHVKNILQAETEQETSYRMNLPRLGNCIIINNLATAEPGSKADVTALRTAHETVGFDVHEYRNCDAQEFGRIKTWMTAEESHQHCNAFSLVLMCRGTEEGDLMDCNGERVTSVAELTDEIVKVPTLNKKPKIIIIQQCTGNASDAPSIELPKLPQRNDVYIAYSTITKYSATDSQDVGSEYLQAYAKYLKLEYMNKPVDAMFRLVNQVMKQKAILTDAVMMKMADHVEIRAMESIALASLKIEEPAIEHAKYSRRDKANLIIFDIMSLWRNQAADNTKEKLAEIMLQSEKVNPNHVKNILQAETEELNQRSVERNCFSKALHFSDFHMVERRKIRILEEQVKELENKKGKVKLQYENQIQYLKQEMEHLKMSEKEKLCKLKKMQKEKEEIESKRDLEREKVKDLEKELENYYDHYQNHIRRVKAEKDAERQILMKDEQEKLKKIQEENKRNEEELKREIRRIKEEQTNLEKSLVEITLDKDKYEKEMDLMRQEKERQRVRLRKAELETIRHLEEAAKISAQRLKNLTKDESSGEEVTASPHGTSTQEEEEKSKKLGEHLQELRREAEMVRLEEKHQAELHRMEEEKRRESERLKDAEAERFRQMQEEMRISAQRQLTEEKVKYEKTLQTELENLRAEKEREKERLKETDEERIRKLEQEAKRSAQKIQQLTAEKHKFEEETERMREAETEKMSKLEEEKKQLEEKLARTRPSVMLQLISTHDTDLSRSGGLTVMRKTGQVVVRGRRQLLDQWSLFVFNWKRGFWRKEKVVRSLCQHDDVHLLDVDANFLGGKQVLAVSCWQCEDLKVLEVYTEQSAKVYSGKVLNMCHGDTDRLYVKSHFGFVKELSCYGQEFDEIKTINTGISDMYYDLCYMSPQRLIAICGKSKINVISCMENKILRSVEGEIDGVKINPRGLCFSHQHNALLVGDGKNSRILVLDPDTREHRQTINLPDIGEIYDLCSYENQIVMQHKVQRKFKLSCFSVACK